LVSKTFELSNQQMNHHNVTEYDDWKVIDTLKLTTIDHAILFIHTECNNAFKGDLSWQLGY